MKIDKLYKHVNNRDVAILPLNIVKKDNGYLIRCKYVNLHSLRATGMRYYMGCDKVIFLDFGQIKLYKEVKENETN